MPRRLGRLAQERELRQAVELAVSYEREQGRAREAALTAQHREREAVPANEAVSAKGLSSPTG